MATLLLFVVFGLSAQSYVGVNLKGSDGLQPMVSIEGGWDTETLVSPYLQIGIMQGSALAGTNIKIGQSPFYVFGGVGFTLAQETITTEYAVEVDSEGNIEGTAEVESTGTIQILWWNIPVETTGSGPVTGTANVSGTASFTTVDSHMIALPTAEIGFGINMQHLFSKIGYSYVGNGTVNNHGFTFFMGYSF